MEDADGQAISVGYKGMLMFEVVAINSSGIMWQGGIDGTQVIVTKDGGNAHKGKGNWPGVP